MLSLLFDCGVVGAYVTHLTGISVPIGPVHTFPIFPMMKTDLIKIYGLRTAAIVFSAYVGSIAGTLAYGGNLRLDIYDLNPFGLAATVGMAAITPGANIALLISIALGVLVVACRWPLWSAIIIAPGFAFVAYALRVAWRVAGC